MTTNEHDESTEPVRVTKGRVFDIRAHRAVDLREDSLLWLINRQVFHPRGYALMLDTETGEFFVQGDGTEPYAFEDCGHGEKHHLDRIKEILP